jgi:hypothetical protein
MSGQLGWFVLRYTDGELQDVLQTARSFGAIDTPNSAGLDEPVHGNVELADDAKKLKAPRGASLLDLGKNGVWATVLMWNIFGGAEKPVVTAAGLIGPPALAAGAWFLTRRWWVVAALLLIWLAIVLFFGARGERDLKAAAKSWPRLQAYRPWRYTFDTHAWRQWFFPLAEWFFAALISGAVLIGGREAIYLGASAGVVGLMGLVLYRWRIRPLKSRWISEANRVYACRRKQSAPPAITSAASKGKD